MCVRKEVGWRGASLGREGLHTSGKLCISSMAKLRNANIGVQYDLAGSRLSLFLLPNLLRACCEDSVLSREGGISILEAVQQRRKIAVNERGKSFLKPREKAWNAYIRIPPSQPNRTKNINVR